MHADPSQPGPPRDPAAPPADAPAGTGPATDTERRLRESDALLRTIGDVAPDFLWVADAAGEIVYVNRRWCEYTGLTAEQMRQRGFLRPMHPDDVGPFTETIERAIGRGEEFEQEMRYRRHDGAYRWFWTRSVPLRDGSGKVGQRVGLSRDVDDRKRAEVALRHSRDLLDGVFELAAVGLTLTDDQGRIVRVNRAFAEMCGYAPEELAGREGLSMLLAPEQREEAELHRQGRRRGEASPPRDWVILTKDGRRRVLRTAASDFLEAGGSRLLIGVAHDVTEQREGETALLQAGLRLHSVLDSIAEGYVVLDAEFRFAEINPAAQRIVFDGRPVADLLGRPFWDEYPQGRGNEFYEQYHRAVRERTPVHFEARSAVAGRWFETHAYPRDDGRLEIYFRDITARKQAEEALRGALASVRDREAQVRLIADNVPALIGYIDRGLCYRFANSAYYDWIGLTPAQVVGKTVDQLLPAPVFEQRRPYMERALAGHAVRFEGPSPHKDLGERQTEVCYAPDADPADPGGPVRGFFVFVYDVTDRNASEAALRENERSLRESEGRLARAQRIARVGDWEIDWPTQAVRWSEEMYRLFGVPRDAFAPSVEGFFSAVPSEDHAPLRAALISVAGGGAGFGVDHRVVWPDGTVRFVSEQAEVIRDADGRPVRVVGTMLDITERKVAEAALAASEQEFRTIFELSSSGKGQADPYTSKLLRVNRKFCEIVGYTEREMLERTTFDLTHPDDVAADRARVARLLAGDMTEWQTDKRYVRKDGQAVWVTVAGSLVRDAAGRPLRLIATVQDVTARRQAEEAVRVAKEQAEAAKEQAESANKAKDHFLAVLSHELRTPLTPVVMTLAGLEMDRSLSQGVRDDLAMIRRNVELETKLIDDLLDVTRIANGKLRLHPQPADAHALLDSVIDLFQGDVRAKRLTLRRDMRAADARVSGDPARLQQVFWNLVRNAIKFTGEGGNVHVHTHNPAPGTLAVVVRDDGVGIDASALPRLFTAFEQADQSVARQFGGLGLGLAISRALVELHGGTVRVESPGRGGGATFTVELPTLTAVERIVNDIQGAGPAAPHAEVGAGPGGPPSQPHVRVLLVEDHPDTLRILKRLLEKMGYAVVPASTAADAIAALAAHAVDVIVSDIGLPDATGHELIRKVRASEAHGGLPAIAISGFGMDADVRNSHEAGFLTHMTKPVDVRQLDAAIRNAVSQKAAAESNRP